jgi:hypothetical protein
MEYKTKYKCRLCGAEFYGPVVTNDKSTAVNCLVHMVADIRGAIAEAPGLKLMHICGGDHEGSLGLADFQGWEAVR